MQKVTLISNISDKIWLLAKYYLRKEPNVN